MSAIKDPSRALLIIGAGPIVIGQACEFDYSGTQAVKALREEGYRIILVNSNPATIMTDPGFADRTYLEPLDVESVADVLRLERPDALLATMGGGTALNLARDVKPRAMTRDTDWGVPVPVDGYPDAASVQRSAPTRLSDEFLTEIAHRYGRNSAELAIAWVLRQPRVTAAIVGARKPGQIKETVFGGKFAIKPDDLAKIDEALAAPGDPAPRMARAAEFSVATGAAAYVAMIEEVLAERQHR